MQKLKEIMKILEETKAKDIVLYDYEKQSPFFDYVFVATTTSRQSNAISGYLKEKNILNTTRVEGKDTSWTLIDLGDIIIHLFSSEDRKNYNFDERLINIKKINI